MVDGTFRVGDADVVFLGPWFVSQQAILVRWNQPGKGMTTTPIPHKWSCVQDGSTLVFSGESLTGGPWEIKIAAGTISHVEPAHSIKVG